MAQAALKQPGLLLCAGLFVAGLAAITAINAQPGGLDVPSAETRIDHGSPDDGKVLQTAVLAGGCFWGMESVFEHVRGVEDVIAGYIGRDADTATYGHVSAGNTGHAEAVRIVFDPAVIAYTDLLQIYFSVAHDATQIGRQGPDIGSQYRSAIFAVSPAQARLAKAYIAQLDTTGLFDRAITTTVTTAPPFHRAEALHQDYAARFPDNLYVRMYDAPLVEALESRLPERYRTRPAWMTAGR